MTPKKRRTQNLNTALQDLSVQWPFPCYNWLSNIEYCEQEAVVPERGQERTQGHHGLSSVRHNNSDLWKWVFLINQDIVDANCVLPLLHPQLSEKETSRWQAEENILVFLNDFLFHVEDSAVTGYDGQLIVMKTVRNWRGWREFARGTFWSS